MLGLEDERLVGMSALDLGWVIEEHARQFPTIRADGLLSLYLDEIQTVVGWETLVHRLVEAKDVEVVVSGSSAKLLSQEVATAARGRLFEVLVHPFSFREAVRHAKAEPVGPWHEFSPAERASLDARLRDYLRTGGFAEAQGSDPRDRARLLTGYVDTMVLRDVIERHSVTNPTALRALQRHLLSAPGGSFTVHKFYNFLKSQGVSIGKDTLHAYLGYLQDAFPRPRARHAQRVGKAADGQRAQGVSGRHGADPTVRATRTGAPRACPRDGSVARVGTEGVRRDMAAGRRP
jgi:uncharacterized protein